METAIGVFDSPERAREAVRKLLASKVPQDSVIFLTRSGTDAEVVGRELSKGAVTGITGASVGAIAASMFSFRESAESCSDWVWARPP